MRLRAIGCCLYYGLVPWQLYEDQCHYAPWGYWRHLRENLIYGLRWLTFRDRPEDRAFEVQVNDVRRCAHLGLPDAYRDAPACRGASRCCGTDGQGDSMSQELERVPVERYSYGAGYRAAVADAVRLLRHAETLERIPGAALGLPKHNPLWEAGTLLETELKP
jgi:hypothetical protein